MTLKRSLLMLFCALGITLSACAQQTPVPPTPTPQVNVTGTWDGGEVVQEGTEGLAVTLALTQTGTAITGSATSAYAIPVTGTLNNSHVTLRGSDSTYDLAFELDVQTATMTGTLVVTESGVPQTFNIALQKQ